MRRRSSGEWRSTPVNLLDHQGVQYLVAPRGNTQWVRNLRAAGEGEPPRIAPGCPAFANSSVFANSGVPESR